MNVKLIVFHISPRVTVSNDGTNMPFSEVIDWDWQEIIWSDNIVWNNFFAEDLNANCETNWKITKTYPTIFELCTTAKTTSSEEPSISYFGMTFTRSPAICVDLSYVVSPSSETKYSSFKISSVTLSIYSSYEIWRGWVKFICTLILSFSQFDKWKSKSITSLMYSSNI